MAITQEGTSSPYSDEHEIETKEKEEKQHIILSPSGAHKWGANSHHRVRHKPLADHLHQNYLKSNKSRGFKLLHSETIV